MDAVLLSVWTLIAYAVAVGSSAEVAREGQRRAGPPKAGRSPVLEVGATSPDRALERLKRTYMPEMTMDPPARTMSTAQNRLGRPSPVIVHPACPNENCQRVYYNISSEDQLDNIGPQCPFCEKPFQGDRWYRSSNVSFLCPGSNQHVSRIARVIVQTILPSSGHEYTDNSRMGSYGIFDQWQAICFGTMMIPTRLNIIVDEYQTSRTSFGRTNSNGPILAHIANLPSEARGNMVLTLVLGITPSE